MQGKYSSWFQYLPVYLQRQWVRYHVNKLISWDDTETQNAKPGCTALIGMCSRLEDVLAGNLACLSAFRWPELVEVIVVADTLKGNLSEGFEEKIKNQFPELSIRFLYYNERQVKLTESFRLPYIFSWLSWSIAVNACKTDTVLLHDYDALILSPALARRYYRFRESDAAIQGIRWYKVNGFEESDQLATTFEAFIDVNWIKSFPPVRMFNQIGILDGRSVDYDTTLEAQARFTPVAKRSVMPMGIDDMVHPSQMIHQYTMFRKHPGERMASFSIPMIPFFQYLSGESDALSRAATQLQEGTRERVDLFDDGTLINFSDLTVKNINWLLKQMVQVCVKREIKPFASFIHYGNALYESCDVPTDQRWLADLDEHQQHWVDSAIATP